MQDVLCESLLLQPASDTAPEFRRAAAPVDYPAAVAAMEARAAAIAGHEKPDAVWFLQHPALYTGGTSAKPQDLLRQDLPVYETGRGGQYTYHGPGQRVAYVMCDLRRRGNDLRRYVHDLEEWLILSLASFGIAGGRRAGRVGIWVDLAPYGRRGEAKIAAIGVRVRRGVAYHGVSVNLNPRLADFAGIVPCGIHEHGVTSFADLGLPDIGMEALDAALVDNFTKVFQPLALGQTG